MTIRKPDFNWAAMKLEELARCRSVVRYQAGDEEVVCANDLVPVVWAHGHLEHDPAYIRRLRNATYDERWPND